MPELGETWLEEVDEVVIDHDAIEADTAVMFGGGDVTGLFNRTKLSGEKLTKVHIWNGKSWVTFIDNGQPVNVRMWE